jgi:hypothetical protein
MLRSDPDAEGEADGGGYEPRPGGGGAWGGGAAGRGAGARLPGGGVEGKDGRWPVWAASDGMLGRLEGMLGDVGRGRLGWDARCTP